MVKVNVIKFGSAYYIDYVQAGDALYKPTTELYTELVRLIMYIDRWLFEREFVDNYELLITHHE